MSFLSPPPVPGQLRIALSRGEGTCARRGVRMSVSGDLLRAAASGDVAALSRAGRALATPVAHIVDEQGATAMHIAAAADSADAVAVLFEVARGVGGTTAQYGHDQAAALAYIQATDKLDATPLHYAARNGAAAAARRLLQFGALVDATDADGRTPRDVANGTEVLAFLD